jgi:hypothetical protein
MITDDDFIHLPELYLKFGDLKKYLDNLYNLKIYTMNHDYRKLTDSNVWGLDAGNIAVIEEEGFFDGGGHWIFNKVGADYEAVYDGNFMHVFGSLEDLMARENEIAYYEYSPELSEEKGEETFVNAEGNIREYANGGGVKKRSLMSVAHLVDWKGEGIKKWYIRSYRTDDLGEELNDTSTFTDLWNGIHNKENVYNIMGVADSVIRERLFEYLSLIYDVEYSYVYNKWLESSEYADGGGIKNENREMLMNNNKQIKHHTTELSSAIKKSKHIPAWVVSKMGRSTSDISDITHYLDGQAANGKRIRKPLYAIMMGKYSQMDNPQYVEVSSEDMNEAMSKFKAMGVDAVPSSIHFSKQPPYYYTNGGGVGNQGLLNKNYLDSIPAEKKAFILKDIAEHYGISVERVLGEVTSSDAEELADYIPGRGALEVFNAMKSMKMANGGNVGRDAMFRSQEPHEQRYDRKREWKEYKKDNWLANDWFADGGGIGVEYNYEILAKNTLTGEENIVCQVRMFGDVPHIIKGLQNAVGSSPITYIHKNIENKAAQGMFLEGEFEEIVAKTKAYISKYPYVWTKGNKSYVPIEGWQYAASLMGLSARVSEVTPMSEKNGWMAKAEVVNQTGVVVCSGFGFVGRDEPKWARSPETDLEAFAQTKAVSRALRNCISYLIKAAGYSTTPAEEMYGVSKSAKKQPQGSYKSKSTEGGIGAHNSFVSGGKKKEEEDFIFDRPEYRFPEEPKSVFARSTQPPIVKAGKKEEGKFYALLKEMYHNAVSTGIIIKSKEFMEEIDATLFAHGDTEEDYRLMIADGFSWLLDHGFVLKSRIFMNKIRSAIAYARLD